MKKMMFVAVAASMAALSHAYEFVTVKDVPYRSEEELAREGDYARDRCTVDLKYPEGVTNFATVVNFHGGGLVRGNGSWAAWPEEAKDEDPVAFVAVRYRLLTNATPEQCVSDAGAAVAWTLKNISRYGGDPKKVFVTGISGGGYLTAMVGMDPKWLAPYGYKPTDLGGIAPLTGQMAKHFNVRKVGFKDDDPTFLPKIDEWAPLAYASTNALPPSCFLTGGRDIEWKGRVEENALLEASLRANGCTNCEFHETEGNHGGGVYPSKYFLRDFVMKTCDAGGVARFADGERVAFFGDSITHGGYYYAYLQLFWCLRNPGSGVRIMNCGISGDTAKGALGRADVDLLPLKPDRVFVMFGMNDVGLGCYKSATPSEADVKERKERFDAYVANQREIVNMLARHGIKTVLMTPTPYDQYSSLKSKEPSVEGNEPGLASLADAVRRLAAERNLGTVELHRPLTELFRSNPDHYFCRDRVHPGPDGHMLIAAYVLDAMRINPFVARIAVNAAAGKVYRASDKKHVDAAGKKLPDTFNAAVTHVDVRGDGVAFTYAPKALPFPAIEAYTNAEAFYPLTERFNQEVFIVEELAPGTYELAFDGEKAGEFTAEAFRAGVNVALLDTPNQRIAAEAAKLAKQLRDKCAAWRNVINMEKRILRRQHISPDDREAADKFFDEWLEGMAKRKGSATTYYRNSVKSYRSMRDRKTELRAEIDDLYERLNAVRPAVSRVTLKRK